MRLARGETTKRESFEVHKGRSDNEEVTSQFGPGIYFFDWKQRKKAIPYAMENPASNIYMTDMSGWDDDCEEPDEYVEQGYFYGCKLSQTMPLLDEISAEIMKPELPALIKEISLATKCNQTCLMEDVNDKFEPDEDYEHYLLNHDDSAYGVIMALWETLEPECGQAFCNALLPTLEKIGSFAANVDRKAGEVIVYDPSKITIDRVIEVTHDPDYIFDRDNPRNKFLIDGQPTSGF